MKIQSRSELKRVIEEDVKQYRKAGYRNSFLSRIMCNEVGELVRYMKALCHEEYYLSKCEVSKCLYYKLGYIYWRRRKNWGGVRLGISIPPHTVGVGFHILHSGNVIINPKALVGDYVTCVGMNCIGLAHLNQKNEGYPVVEDNVIIGIGAKIIGNVVVKKGSIVAANAVVCRKHVAEGAILAGVPATEMKKEK